MKQNGGAQGKEGRKKPGGKLLSSLMDKLGSLLLAFLKEKWNRDLWNQRK